MSTPQVTVYTQPGCPACTQVKAYLQARNVAYLERDVRNDDDAGRELYDRGYSATPLTVVGEVEILGLNRAKFEAALR